MKKGKENLEEKVEQNTKRVWWLTIVMIVLLIAVGLGGYLIGASKIANDVVEQKENSRENSKLEITSSIRNKIEKFVNVGSHFDYTGANNTMEYFTNGASEITKEVKLKMTRNAIYLDGKLKKDVVLSDEDASKIEGVKPENGEIVDEIKESDFKNTYKELFNEEAYYDFSELKNIGCPAPLGIDNSTKTYYLYHRCGGTGVISYEGKIISIDSDSNYYYAHQEITEINGNTNETRKIKTTWKFDKNLNFVNTKKE